MVTRSAGLSESASGSRSGLRSAGTAQSFPRSQMTSTLPSPLASNQSSRVGQLGAPLLPRSKCSRLGRGASSSRVTPPSPRFPVTGSLSQTSPPLTARSEE